MPDDTEQYLRAVDRGLGPLAAIQKLAALEHLRMSRTNSPDTNTQLDRRIDQVRDDVLNLAEPDEQVTHKLNVARAMLQILVTLWVILTSPLPPPVSTEYIVRYVLSRAVWPAFDPAIETEVTEVLLTPGSLAAFQKYRQYRSAPDA